MQKPKKWTEIYPQGTKEGDEEQKFFIALARDPKYDWRSIAMLVKESKLSRKRIEEIIAKYLSVKPPLVLASSTKDEHFAYWERVPTLLKDDTSLTKSDHERRINIQRGT